MISTRSNKTSTLASRFQADVAGNGLRQPVGRPPAALAGLLADLFQRGKRLKRLRTGTVSLIERFALYLRRSPLMALRAGPNCVATVGRVTSSRASFSNWINSSTVAGSMIACHVNAGTIDIHTCLRYVVMAMVASTPSVPLTETLRGIPRVSDTWAAFSREGVDAPGAGFETEARGLLRYGDLQPQPVLSRHRVLASTKARRVRRRPERKRRRFVVLM